MPSSTTLKESVPCANAGVVLSISKARTAGLIFMAYLRCLRGLPETQLFKSSGLVLLGFLNDVFQSGRFLEVTLRASQRRADFIQ